MLWGTKNSYFIEPYDIEANLEQTIQIVKHELFGPNRIYLETKKRIGNTGTKNIPDAYLLDLSSNRTPKLYVVENELSRHETIKHIAVQILEFSLSYEETPYKVKQIVKTEILNDNAALKTCQEYIEKNNFHNIDNLLEKIIFKPNSFNALIIIDDVSEELEKVVISRFKFPVELITLIRYKTDQDEYLYEFEPFLAGVEGIQHDSLGHENTSTLTIDPSEIDTIVVPAQEEGFNDVFIGENRWYAIRMSSTMIPNIKYIAAYQVAPISSITHIAKVDKISQWQDTNKYVLDFEEPATEIGPLSLVTNGRVKAPQAPRYTALKLLEKAKTLDDAF